MPVDKAGVQALVRQEAVDLAEKHKLLLLAASKAELWGGLQEDEVVGVLRQALADTASGRTCNPPVSPAGNVGRLLKDESKCSGLYSLFQAQHRLSCSASIE